LSPISTGVRLGLVQYLRLALVAAVCLGLYLLLLPTIYRGLATGKILHSTSDTYCHRSTNPIGFWSLVGLFSGAVATCSFILWRAAKQTFGP
jgi:hypothetical protein